MKLPAAVLIICPIANSFRSITHSCIVHKHICKAAHDELKSTVPENIGNNPPLDSSIQRVDDVIAKIKEMLVSKTTADLTAEETSENVDVLNNKFEKLIRDIKSSSSLSDSDKLMYFSEAMLTMKNSDFGLPSNLPKLDSNFPNTVLFSDSASPYVCCYSSGLVGLNLKDTFKQIGPSVAVKYLDLDRILGLQDAELKYIVKNSKTVLIACDAAGSNASGKGWFAPEPAFTTLTSDMLKKLFRAIVSVRGGQSDSAPVKIVFLTKGCKEKKSVASLLLADNTDIEDEAILLCQQRNFNYAIVRVGTIVSNEAAVPEGSLYKSIRDSFKSKNLNPHLVLKSPITVSTSRVDANEHTRASAAAEAMLRISDYPLCNTTFAILSNPSTTAVTVSQSQWNDEFGKLIGPELYRFPLQYASAAQVMLKLGRSLKTFEKPGSGLITPIEVSRYSNAIKLVFKPKESSYSSYKDEKSYDKKVAKISPPPPPVSEDSAIVQRLGYISPEEEERLATEKRNKNNEANTKSSIPSYNEIPVISQRDLIKFDGGLEICVDEEPYKRVRIRRCNMGPKTIVKEESEGILIKHILNSIQVLENDYRILLNSNFDVHARML